MDSVRTVLFALSALLAVMVLLGVLVAMSGDGGLKGKLTLSGVYSVRPAGFQVVCFISKDAGAMDCLTLTEARASN